MKCAREKCPYKARRQGLCAKHYDAHPDRGFVDGTATRERIALLLARGVGHQAISDATGLAVWWLRKSTGSVRVKTQQQVFSIPIPKTVVAGGMVPAVGTLRRLKALAAIGWSLRDQGIMLGHTRSYVLQLVSRPPVEVLSSTAVKVDDLYRKLSMTTGPSSSARSRAQSKGWPPPLAWDNIDDPNETPDMGVDAQASFEERYTEMRALGFTAEAIAKRMGIKFESLERQLIRHGLFEGRAA